ncbi:unnamed protein product [Mytilus coruscus]|uniref:Uncharacterized protein n=1 Tax=Mytilus coruscus TaxID=42192 RepID=A0A6J8CT69_MYTCO|nr:unnamed protein product [Mytilus coruscus]
MTDSIIVQTRHTDFDDATECTVQTQLQRADVLQHCLDLKVGKGTLSIQNGKGISNVTTVVNMDIINENVGYESKATMAMVIPLNFTGQLDCYRVSVVEDTWLQPGTEALVRGHINEYALTKNEEGVGIIEPCDKFIAKDSALYINGKNFSECLRNRTTALYDGIKCS